MKPAIMGLLGLFLAGCAGVPIKGKACYKGTCASASYDGKTVAVGVEVN